jgi:hypothetical protein
MKRVVLTSFSEGRSHGQRPDFAQRLDRYDAVGRIGYTRIYQHGRWIRLLSKKVYLPYLQQKVEELVELVCNDDRTKLSRFVPYQHYIWSSRANEGI